MASEDLKKWLAANVVPALTLIGVTLYVLLRLPYAMYYGRLGTTPEDVGLGYVEMLAQSALGLGAVVFVGVLTVAIVATLVVVFALYARLLPAMVRGEVAAFPRPAHALTDDQWAKQRAIYKAILTRVYRASADEVESLLAVTDERRTLHRRPARSADEQQRLDEIVASEAARDSGLLRRALTRWLRKVGVPAAIVTGVALVALPFGARWEADRVRDCLRPVSGRYGMFAVRGTSATVVRLEDDGSTVPVQGGRRLHYLGRTDKGIVLFACDGDDTVRIPADGVVVVEDTERGDRWAGWGSNPQPTA